MKGRFELQIHSIAVGAARHWVLYAVPFSEEHEVERVECIDLGELDLLLARLKNMGVSERALAMARKSITERNVSCELGTFDLTLMDRSVLRLEPVPGFTARDANLLSIEESVTANEEIEAKDQD